MSSPPRPASRSPDPTTSPPTGRFARWIRLPVRFLIWLKGRLLPARSPQAARAQEKARQAGVRRELRGLPAEHDADAPRPTKDTPADPSP